MVHNAQPKGADFMHTKRKKESMVQGALHYSASEDASSIEEDPLPYGEGASPLSAGASSYSPAASSWSFCISWITKFTMSGKSTVMSGYSWSSFLLASTKLSRDALATSSCPSSEWAKFLRDAFSSLISL
ncbi:unnamed protein product [Linum trigynum]|uniref:Uncharacterized protein n=1 Tax=Linum trigynum TaxID=586398 RepID=A0AAV2F4M5_9ROSI